MCLLLSDFLASSVLRELSSLLAHLHNPLMHCCHTKAASCASQDYSCPSPQTGELARWAQLLADMPALPLWVVPSEGPSLDSFLSFFFLTDFYFFFFRVVLDSQQNPVNMPYTSSPRMRSLLHYQHPDQSGNFLRWTNLHWRIFIIHRTYLHQDALCVLYILCVWLNAWWHLPDITVLHYIFSLL